jgi:hypothetical protein
MRVAVAVVLATAFGCPPTVERKPVIALDSISVPLNRVGGFTETQLIPTLGRPTDRRTGQGLSRRDVFVRYPIRMFADSSGDIVISRAAILRVVFDAHGEVSKWLFIDPRGQQPLAMIESLEEARLWEKNEPCKTVPTLAQLDVALRPRHANRASVKAALAQFTPSHGIEEGPPLPFPRKFRTTKEEVWDYDVDRPSPLFIPSMYYERITDSSGFIRISLSGGMGSCVGL